MFNKVYWDKARVPALVLLLASIICALVQELFLDLRAPGIVYTCSSIIPSVLFVQFLAYLSGRTLVDPDEEGSSGIWNNYILWILFEIIASFIIIFDKIVIYSR